MLRQSDILFISHGGGPRPLMGDPSHQQLVEALRALSSEMAPPKTVLVISAHWESAPLAVTAASDPDLLFDYNGFPDEAYALQYPCPGSPELARSVQACLNSSGLECVLDFERGLDHGVFVPMKLMYPQADIPCLQLSISKDLDPARHIAIGAALSKLDAEGLLVIGSGFSFHNMRAFYADNSEEIRTANQSFEDWLESTLTSDELSSSEIQTRLINWEQAPHARFCHPREDHLLPLHVCFGLTGRQADDYKRIEVFNKASSLFHWKPN